MSGAEGGAEEVVNVLTCIASITSAYHDAAAVIQKLKARRAERRASPPPCVLEDTIGQAPEEIENEQDRGRARFGSAFDTGDHLAVIALQHVTIQLQGTLLEKLKDAAFDDSDDDGNGYLPELVDAAELGRNNTISALLELTHRLLDASATGAVDGKEVTPKNSIGNGKANGGGESNAGRASTWSGTVRHSGEEERDATAGAEEPHGGRRHRHASLLGFLRHVRERSNSLKAPIGEEVPEPPNAAPKTLGLRPPAQCDVRDGVAAIQTGDVSRLGSTYPGGNDSRTPSQPSLDSGHRDHRGSIQLSSEPGSSGPSTRNNSVVAFSPPPLSATRTGLSQYGSSLAPSGTVVPIRQPTSENNYLGFCKGAWRLQNGDHKSLQRSKEFNDGWSQSHVYCLTCTTGKCAFAGHISLDAIWIKVWSIEALGVQFRWPFLAKSHVQQHKIKDKKFLYQCLFCAFLGLQVPSFHGTDPYLEHVSKEHRGRPLNDVLLYKTSCVADHICEEGEDFDINLFPLTTAEQADMDLKLRAEQLTIDEAVAGPSQRGVAKQDSMFSGPWNEGLSEFHYGDEMEATQKDFP